MQIQEFDHIAKNDGQNIQKYTCVYYANLRHICKTCTEYLYVIYVKIQIQNFYVSTLCLFVYHEDIISCFMISR